MTACRRWTSVHTTARGLDRGTCSLHPWTQALRQLIVLLRKRRVYLVDPWTTGGDSDHRCLDPFHCLKEFFRRHGHNLVFRPFTTRNRMSAPGTFASAACPHTALRTSPLGSSRHGQSADSTSPRAARACRPQRACRHRSAVGRARRGSPQGGELA
jgi:hypothetical protein